MGVCERPHRWGLTILTFEPDVDDPREADRIGAMIRSQREDGRLNTRAAPIVLLALLFACASTEPENSASSVAPEVASTATIVDRCGAVDLFDAARRKVSPVVLFTEWSGVSSGHGREYRATAHTNYTYDYTGTTNQCPPPVSYHNET